ncbi:glycosyltransferase family 4 protein [Geobacter argillaceus]|uniref:Glycosyltransferase involved in cell wall biosynthesis n=1 Tax=Geobacter argillaceus TaxID=345631 RepID=A0A562VFM9_9BACT|nr:glycosyltransferase family 4 protein [Geobacter argillaceus]TWJ16716.1 glycosyltransferase involved in cell wall biosynthesis [Geobacter argillaceus]
MKILLAHNFYRSSAPSGEDMVYRNERALLERNGVEVIPYERFNDDIDESTLTKRVRLALSAAWSRPSHREITEIIRRERPDVAHFHNTFPLISPSAYAACRENGVPVVQTLHNFRFVCPQAMLMRNGHPCGECLGTSLLPALRHRCYRGSFPATLAQVLTIFLNRRLGTYRSKVNRYLALTRFSAGRLADGGLPAENLTVKPNFLPDPPVPGEGDGGYALFAGRLSPEKGLVTLLAAWRRNPGLPLKVFGAGPLEAELKRVVDVEGLPVEFHGFCDRQQIYDAMSRAEFVVVPSECYEGFPMVVLEAMACGTPVVASRLGSLAEVVVNGINGVTFSPGDPTDLASVIVELRKDRQRLAAMRYRCRLHFDQHYSEEHALTALLDIYASVCRDVRLGNPPR